jgi:hypothetical protein
MQRQAAPYQAAILHRLKVACHHGAPDGLLGQLQLSISHGVPAKVLQRGVELQGTVFKGWGWS